MNYSKIISFVYALLAVGYGTYFCIMYIDYYMVTINGYNSRIKTIGTIKTINCYDKNNCDGDIEYTVNNTKYLAFSKIPNNLKIGDKIEIRYSFNNLNAAFVYGNMHIYAYIYIILIILFIILLWMFLLIVILFSSIYNKFIFLIYAIFITIIISYGFYINIKNNYNNLYKYDDYEDYTIGTIKSHDECYDMDNNNKTKNDVCYSNIEYFIDGVKYNVKLLIYSYKIGKKVKVYYNKDTPEAIEIYDITKNERLIKIFIYIIILILLWIFLFYNIPIILN
jgi:hypothetical protein